MANEALREKAIELADALLGVIKRSAGRGAAIFGADELLTSLIPSFVGYGAGISIAPQIGETYAGERRDLKELLGCKDWVSTALAASAIMKEDAGLVRPGDYFRLPIKAEGGSFDGLGFKALDIPDAELVVVQITLDGKIILNFEEILFFSAINAKDTCKGGFKSSALAKYLNGPFLAALKPIRHILAQNEDRNMVTLPTLFEVYGHDDEGKDGNWEEKPRQFKYFKKVKNRVRVKDNATLWWWLSTATSFASFCAVHSNGLANFYSASSVGGCAPAICIS